MTTAIDSADDIVVGAGIIGLAVAWHLARAGRGVLVIERHAHAHGASVRNFGMIWPIGQPAGWRRQIALRSRELWREVLLESGIWHEPVGSLHLAYSDDEAAVLEEFVREARQSGLTCEPVTPAGVASRSPRANLSGLRVALWSGNELVVDPRDVIARLPRWLAARWGVRFAFDTLVTGCHAGLVETSAGIHRTERLFVCAGDELQTLFPADLEALGLVRCKLQMMRTQPVSWRLGPMLAAGLTLGHYDAFAACPSRGALRQRFAAELPEYVRYGIHVMASQNESGELTLGDSHEYGEAITPFDRPEIDRLVLDYLPRFLDISGLEISSRWHGVYVKHPSEPFCVVHPAPGVTALVGFGGAGMTLSFGAAEHVLRSV